jgi:hypothetical protein
VSKGAVPGAEGQTRKKRTLMRLLRNVLYVGRFLKFRSGDPGRLPNDVRAERLTRGQSTLD